jgi:hypothetical protein
MKLRYLLVVLTLSGFLSGCCWCRHHHHCCKPPSEPLPAGTAVILPEKVP